MAHPGARRLGAAGRKEAIRALAAWFELANIEDRLASWPAARRRRPFTLGGLATAWPRLAEARTVSECAARSPPRRGAIPGDAEPADVRLGLRLAWARRVLQSVPEAGDWAAGAVALVVARELFLAGRSADDLATHRPPGIGVEWAEAGSLRTLREALPAQAAWALGASRSPATCGAPRWPGGGASSRTRWSSRMPRSWASRW